MTVDSNNKYIPSALISSSNGCFSTKLGLTDRNPAGEWNKRLAKSFGVLNFSSMHPELNLEKKLCLESPGEFPLWAPQTVCFYACKHHKGRKLDNTKNFPGNRGRKLFSLPTSRPLGLGLHCLYPWQLRSSISCTCSWFKMPRSTVCTVFVSCGRRARMICWGPCSRYSTFNDLRRMKT